MAFDLMYFIYVTKVPKFQSKHLRFAWIKNHNWCK